MKIRVLAWFLVLGMVSGMGQSAWALCGDEGFSYPSQDNETTSCGTPYGLSVSNISGTYAMLSWQYDTTVNGEAPGFTLIVTDGLGVEYGMISVNGSERSYILVDLEERMSYHVQLSADCEGGDTVELYFTTVCNSGGERQVGTGTSTNSYLPAYLFAVSSVSQQLFTAEELSGVVAIEGFKIYMTSSAATPDRQWDVYLDTTSRASFSSVNDYVVPTTAQRHFSGSVSFSQGWVTVEFDSIFTVPADKNVVLTVYDKTASSASSRSFRTTVTTDTMTLYGYSTTELLNATSASVFSGATSNVLKRRNTIKFMTTCDTNTCMPPVITSVVPAAHSVTLTWQAGGSETEWKVEYRTGTGAWIEATSYTTATTYTVAGLASTTTYAFRVSSLCGVETFRTVTSTTLCGEEPLPFAEGFEVFLASPYDNQLKQCWYRGSNNPSTYTYYPSRTSNYSHSGNYSIAMGGYRGYLVIPLMDAAIDSLSVSFYAYNSDIDEPAELEVGVCSNPADTGTFAVVAIYEVADTGWMRLEADLEYYTGTGGNIFIRVRRNDYSSLFIDDIAVNYLPDCRRVSGVTVNEVTVSSATLTIVDGHNYGDYIVYYGTVNDTSFADTMQVTGTTVALTGLAENTQYYVWVVARCSAGSVGRAFIVPPFRTPCLPVTVTATEPYLEEFEVGRMDCMNQESADGLKWLLVMGDDNTHGHSGSHMVAVASTHNHSALLVLPTFDFSGMVEDAELCFYHNQYHLLEDTVTPVGMLQVYYRSTPTGEWTYLSTVDNSFNAWERMDCILPSSQGAAFYQVALMGCPNGNNSGIFVDDIKVGAPPTCPRPSIVEVRNIGERAATVVWSGSAAAYRVQYRPVGGTSWASCTVGNVDTVVLSPLDMATSYEVRVAALCTATDRSENSNELMFTTDFCNNRVEGSNYNIGYVSAISTISPVNTAVGYSYSEILVDSATLAGMAEINGISFYVDQVGSASYMTDCQLYMGHTAVDSLSAFQYDSTYLKVFDGDISATSVGERRVRFDTPFVWDGHSNVVLGIMYTTPDFIIHGPTRFVAHQAVVDKVYCASSSWTPFAPGQADTLLAELAGSNLVPNLTFYSCQPNCFEPVVNMITATAASITIDWYNENAIVQLQLKASSATDWESPVLVNNNYNNIHSYTYNYLDESTDYNIRLRRDCTVEDVGFSDWVELVVHTDTVCSIPENIAVTVTGASSATVAWTDGPMSGSRWEIRIWNSVEDHYYDVATNPATVDGLVPGSSYHAAVRSYCCQGDRVVGDFSESVVFDNVCQPVTGLTASVNGGSVVLNWTPGARNTQWLVSYGYQGFEPNDQLGYMIVNTPTATVTGLGAYTAPYADKGVDNNKFTFRVRAICAEGWNSGWSSDVSATLVGIDDVEGANTQVVLQPNPATDRVSLLMSDFEGNAAISILSIDGREMYSFDTHNTTFDFDVSAMAAGTYFVRVQTAEWTAVRKLIVK